jgi:hypothetical protein
VREDVTNVYFTPIVMNDGDQPIFVAANVEHNPIADFID